MQMLYTIFLTTTSSTTSVIVHAIFTVNKQHAFQHVAERNLVLKENICQETSFRYHNAFKATRFLSCLFPFNVTGKDSRFNEKYKFLCPPTLICFMRLKCMLCRSCPGVCLKNAFLQYLFLQSAFLFSSILWKVLEGTCAFNKGS